MNISVFSEVLGWPRIKVVEYKEHGIPRQSTVRKQIGVWEGKRFLYEISRPIFKR